MEYLGGLTLMLLVLAAYWALVTLPKQRAFRTHQIFVRELAVGDEIVTYGGLVGAIVALDSDSGIAIVRLADNLEVRIITAAITQPFNPAELARSAQVGFADEKVQQGEAGR